jgi:hypothetical protein
LNSETEYTINVQTGSEMGAGTDANVFISLYGDQNKIVRHKLQKLASGEDPFERNKRDEFILENLDIGRVCLFYY